MAPLFHLHSSIMPNVSSLYFPFFILETSCLPLISFLYSAFPSLFFPTYPIFLSTVLPFVLLLYCYLCLHSEVVSLDTNPLAWVRSPDMCTCLIIYLFIYLLFHSGWSTIRHLGKHLDCILWLPGYHTGPESRSSWFWPTAGLRALHSISRICYLPHRSLILYSYSLHLSLSCSTLTLPSMSYFPSHFVSLTSPFPPLTPYLSPLPEK